MFKSKNAILYAIIGVLAVFTIIYFLAANQISHAFTYDENAVLYDSKIKMIKNCAEIYAQSDPSMFTEKDTIYVTVSELVEKGFIQPDNDNGDVKDPTSEVKTFNDLKIRLSYKNEKVESKLLLNE